MRYLSMFVVITLVFSLAFTFAAVAAAAPLTPRPLDPLAAETLSRAVAQSATVRDLVATLESSNVIVHIESSRLLPAGIVGTTRFVISRGGYRYVRITLDAELPKWIRAAIVGHELQHACELAESDADNADKVRRLFEREGERHGTFYETRAALETEKYVRMELLGDRRLQAGPAIKFDR